MTAVSNVCCNFGVFCCSSIATWKLFTPQIHVRKRYQLVIQPRYLSLILELPSRNHIILNLPVSTQLLHSSPFLLIWYYYYDVRGKTLWWKQDLSVLKGTVCGGHPATTLCSDCQIWHKQDRRLLKAKNPARAGQWKDTYQQFMVWDLWKYQGILPHNESPVDGKGG